jgi:hypothetical protein
MKNLKKVLALVVALTFVLSTVAFAAPTSDIEDDSVKKAVERLYYFGVVDGKDDGLYHPEENLTREQFAKLVVEAMGLGAAAQASGGDTGFSDVASDRWSAGYVSVASGKGIIKGKGDGTFDPEAGVTYPEAVTMLVRALGYKDEFLVGAWPSNYVAKAAELKIPLGAKYSVSGVVDRGAAAVLVNNTLNAKVITQTSYGDDNNWTEGEDTLLESKMDITKLEDCKITATAFVDDSLDADEVTIDCEDEDYDDAAWDADYVLLNQSANGLLGISGTMYLNDNDDIIYFDVTTKDKNIVTGWITDADVDDYAGDNDNDRTINIQFADGGDDDYGVVDSGDITVYVDNETDSSGDDFADFDSSQYGTFILNSDGDIEFAVVYNIDSIIAVTEVRDSKEEILGRRGTSDDYKVKLGNLDGYKIFLDGEEIGIDDVEVNDVVAFAEDVNEVDGDDYDYAFVIRNIVEGELSKAKNTELTIGGDAYDVNANCAYSLDSGDSSDAYLSAEDIEDAIGEDIVAFLDIKGEIAYFETDVDVTSSTIYGIVTKTNEITSDTVKVFNGAGETVTYSLDDDIAGYSDGANEGDIVKFELSKDGTIDADDYVANVIATDLDDDDAADADDDEEVTIVDFDDDNDSIEVTGNALASSADYYVGDGTYYVTDSTVLISLYDDGDVDPGLVEWDLIKGKTPDSNLRAVIVLDDNGLDIACIVFTDNYDLSGDTTVAYLVDEPYFNSDGDWAIDVVEYDGTEKSYALNTASDRSSFDEGDFVVFNKTASGDLNSFAVTVRDNTYAANSTNVIDGWDITTGEIETISGKVIALTSGDSYKVVSGVGIYALVLDDDGTYDEIDEADISDMDEGDVIQVVCDNDGDVVMIIIFDNSADDTVTIDEM